MDMCTLYDYMFTFLKIAIDYGFHLYTDNEDLGLKKLMDLAEGNGYVFLSDQVYTYICVTKYIRI
jgi:hypothetical protein